MAYAPRSGRERRPGRPAARLRALRAALLAGVAVLAAAPALALAAPPAAPKTPPADDGLGPQDAYIEADTLTDDRESQIVVARGHVEARAGGRTVRADEVTYNRQTGAAHARGNAVLVSADGTVQYAQDLELDDKLRAGVATGFSARLEQNVTIAAGAAIRRTETVQQLNQAIFTPCNICNADGSPHTPSFSIQASRMVQDQDRHVIYFRNAVLRIKNVPILYLPFFWTSDPSGDRRSGLLNPRVEFGKRRGFSYEQPYYWAISPYSDLTISPQINTRVNPLLNLRYQKRFYSGSIDIRNGYTYEQNFTSKLFYDRPSSRSYVLGTGKFDLDKNWIWGFGLERVTDPTFFRRYGIREVFVERGPYPTDTDRLISQIYTRRQDDRSFLSAAAFSFQSVRAYFQDPVTGAIAGESSRTFPLVAPLIEARFSPTTPILGGRLRAQVNAVSLNRDNAVTSLVDPSGTVLPGGPLQNPALAPVLAPGVQTLTYTDSRRVTGQLDWRRAFTVGPGVRVEPFANGRSDLYMVGASSANGGKDDFVARTLGTLGADVSWPLYRNFGRTNVIIEPVAQFALSPLVKPSTRIPNEDSVSFTFDESNLFNTNRFSGFDLYEGGARLNTGVRANAFFPTGNASLLIGRTFRAEPDPAFNSQSGLRGTSSDWIVTASATPIPGLFVFSRSRLDGESLAVHREEAGVTATHGPVSLGVRYIYNESGLNIGTNGAVTVGKVESVDLSGEVRFLKHWGVSANTVRDMQFKVWPRAQIGVFYQDECIRVDVLYTHDEYIGRVDTSDTIGVRLTLATLGDTTPRRVNRGSR